MSRRDAALATAAVAGACMALGYAFDRWPNGTAITVTTAAIYLKFRGMGGAEQKEGE